jgi:hypothetical protein
MSRITESCKELIKGMGEPMIQGPTTDAEALEYVLSITVRRLKHAERVVAAMLADHPSITSKRMSEIMSDQPLVDRG